MIGRVVAAAAILVGALAARADAGPGLGNAWHIAEGAEPGIATMRAPLRPAGGDVTIFTGNQFQGPGNPGNQTQTGSTLFYRNVRSTTWTAAPLTFHSTSGNNKYYRGTIPAPAVQPGDTVEYYLRIAYSDRATTFLFGNDGASSVTGSEAAAQAAPFSYFVAWPAEPSGPFVAHRRGDVEARIATGSGHVSIVGASLAGQPFANAIHLRPGAARIDGRWLTLGRVRASRAITDGIELDQELGRRTVVTRLIARADGVFHYEVVDWGGSRPVETALEAGSRADEHFYGFGEKFNTFDQAGKRVRVMTSDHPGDKGDHSYKVAPWFVSTRGYGFRLDSTAESFFDLRKASPDRWAVQHLFSTLAFDVVYGPRLTDVLSRYTAVVGRAALPPPWVFGPWMSSDHWRDGGEVRYVVTKMIERGIPGSVFVFDSPWEVAYNDFQWNMTQFGRGGTYEGAFWPGFTSVGDLMTFLRSHGFKVVVWLTPFVNVSSFDEGVPGQNLGKASIYDEGAAAGYFVRSSPGGPPLIVEWWKGRGSPVDFTNPAARAWFTGKLRALVAESGGVISGLKIDDGEADFIPLTASYFDGRTGVEMRNGYTVEYHRAMASVLGDEGILFSRSGYTGTQAFPACWAGDNEPNFGAGNGLPSVIVAGQSAAMSGYAFWSHDVGGYQDSNLSSTPANLFMRWTQLGALTPIMQMHRQVHLGMHYPWSFGAEALANYRQYAELHTALFPYIYTYAQQAAATGLPILRPLVLMHPDDPNTYGINHTYFFGDDLLVAPMITNAATERRVYLPPGRWHDFWSDAVFDGGQAITWVNPDQRKLPLFVRAGAVIPFLPGRVQSLAPADYIGNPAIATPDGSLELRVYPDRDQPSQRTFHDGTAVTVELAGPRIEVAITSAPRTTSLRLRGQGVLAVTVAGAPLPELADEAAFDAATTGWIEAAGFVRVKLAHPGGEARVVVELDPEGKEDSAGIAAGDGGGCATTSGAGGLAGLLLVAAALLVARRRR